MTQDEAERLVSALTRIASEYERHDIAAPNYPRLATHLDAVERAVVAVLTNPNDPDTTRRALGWADTIHEYYGDIP